MEDRIFTVTENGFSMTDGKVVIPACRVKAKSYMDAVGKLDRYLDTRELNPDIELITPIEKIDFPKKIHAEVRAWIRKEKK